MVPRLRDRVREPFGGLGSPYWINDTEFDLHYHLRRTRLAGAGGWAELVRVAEQFAMTPFDRARPPWEVQLVEGLDGGRAAYLLKIHHSLTDGTGVTQLLSLLHSRRRESDPEKPQPPAPAPVPVDRRAELTDLVGRELGVLPGAARAAGSALAALGRPRATLRYLGSARRVLGQPATAGSPLLAQRSMSWRFVALDVGFADLRAAGRAAGGSLNDAYLTALMGAFRHYHLESGYAVDADMTIPTSVPVSIRSADDPAGGNRFAPARIAGPMGVADAAERLIAVRAGMTAARAEPALESTDAVAPLLARLPGALLAGVTGSLTRSTDLQASNVPGLRSEAFMCGARIDRVYPFAPLPGCAAMITLVTHGDTCCVGANPDAAAVTDRDLMTECLRRGFSEVLALHPGAAPPVVPG